MSTQLTEINARFEPAVDVETEVSERRHHLAQQVAAVRRRSRRIQLLRMVFPGLIIGIGLLNIGWITVKSILGSMNNYNVSGTEIRMTNPHFSDLSGQGTPYRISGLEMVKKAGNDVVVTLKAPSIEFKGNTDRFTHISAASGVYDTDRKTFRMTGNVIMASGGSDMTFRTEEAVISLKDLSISGDKHIEGTGSMGHIVGESFVISKSGSDVVFRGRGEAKVRGEFNRHAKLRGVGKS